MPVNTRTLVISTCGTSLLTNEADQSTREILSASANLTEGELSEVQRKTVERRITECRDQLFEADIRTIRRRSAELNGLLGFYKNQLGDNSGDVHYLLHTDTFQGQQVADVLESYLRSKGLTALKQTFSDLRTNEIENFRRGITELVKWCEDTLSGYKDKQYRIVFNLTGGFKSLQGWMQTIGMFYADEIVYIFESSSELLHIPRIPIAIEEGARQTIKRHLPLFRRLAQKGETCQTNEIAEDIPEVFLYKVGDMAELSMWGRLIWERCRKNIYAEKLFESPSEKLLYSEKFKRAASRLPSDRLIQINERIDDLVGFLEKGTNPERLDFKPLKGNPCPPSTHECDAWADQAAWRIFMHYERSILILDDVREGLH